MASVRMDKWLWAARFFKTRALSARACELGRIQSNGQPAKAAREGRIGERLGGSKGGGRFERESPAAERGGGPGFVGQTPHRRAGGEAGTAPEGGSGAQGD